MQRLVNMNDLQKPYDVILEHNQFFFKKLNHVRDIHIIGHSCTEIDFPYFQKIKENVDAKAIWHSKPHSYEDRHRMNILINMMGLEPELTTGI